MAEHRYTGVPACIGKRKQLRDDSVAARNKHRGDGIPNTQKLDGRYARPHYLGEVPSDAKVILIARLFVRSEGIVRDIKLVARQQTHKVDHARHRSRRVGASAKSK
jgi:hypothetical protein